MTEATACLRALVAVAKADGKITAEERAALESTFEMLPGSASPQSFLNEQIDFDQTLSQVTSAQAREQLWQAACSIIYADGTASAEEQKLLDKMRNSFHIDEGKASSTRRIFEEAKDTLLPSNIVAVSDPAQRQKEIDQDTIKYSILSALLGAFPVPGIAIATDLAIVALQIKLIRDVGQYWGHRVDKETAKTLLAGLGLGTGARIAVSNLAKLVPVWGSAFGATTAFATTWALGKIANRYFEGGQKSEPGALRSEMKAMESEGKKAFAQYKEQIETKKKSASARLSALNEQRKIGAISQAEYEKQISALAD
ncbi:MAG: DUF533 domain-containing protein [Kofleriaceae bacterium]